MPALATEGLKTTLFASGRAGEGDLVAAGVSPPLDRHPVAVYLSGLSPGSRRTMRGALKSIAAFASAAATELTLSWWRLAGFEPLREG